ncbi:MAG: rhamnose/proton symporter RhaT, partial [Prevotellaceae bacterium]|nr:rhamnose/proton symporter RhaT [Prevotellaceae bacterium]
TYDGGAALKAIVYGALWGVGGLSWGLSMRYLGIALGQSLAYGTCAAFGTIIPPLLAGENLFSTAGGIILLIGICICIAGIAIIGYAGSLKAKNMTPEQQKAAVKEFALKKGILIALLAGVMSACFNLGLQAGKSIQDFAESLGTPRLFSKNVVTFLVTVGGFVTNIAYCIYLNIKNKTGTDYFSVSGKVFLNNILFCALAGTCWYLQFFFLGMGESKLTGAMLAFSWCILMSMNILFSNLWGIWLKEWKGAGWKTMVVLIIGLIVLILSTIFPSLMS